MAYINKMKKETLETFITQAKIIHNNKYNYKKCNLARSW